MEQYTPNQSYIRTATACPEVAVGDVDTNVDAINSLYDQAASQDTSLVVFPELSVTGYTLGDLVNQNQLLDKAKQGLLELANKTAGANTAMVVGIPLQIGNNLYNCAAVLADGRISGIVPKTNLPTYGEFYEDRWYQTWDAENIIVQIGNQETTFGTDMLFDIGEVAVGVEICEDLWVSNPPSSELAIQGALLIANPSASPEQIGKEEYRRQLVAQQSGRLIAGYMYAGCDSSESTMDIVMSGHQLTAVNGHIQAEKPPFDDTRLTISDIDVEHLRHDRRRMGFSSKLGAMTIKTSVKRVQQDLIMSIDKNPFMPEESPTDREERLDKVLAIQARGLVERMKSSHQDRLVLGLSGGLDSTLALFVSLEASKVLGKDPGQMIRTITMPGPASSKDTQSNAQILATSLGIPNEMIPIEPMVRAELKAISHGGNEQDITYENVQARARTSILFNYGNKESCLVLGTGDLSEIALGWCTFNADHMSHYNVNATVPKTMVRHLVAHSAEKYPKAKSVVYEILETPISPELTIDKENLSQETEEIIGPYELHDFFINSHVRWGDSPGKIAYHAEQAFGDTYEKDTIKKWLELYFDRFTRNQFKRSVMPDGPKIGSVALSPRGDWRMPSDMPTSALWK